MEVKINDKTYKVEIVRKRGNKNTYLRVKEDLTIYITTGLFTTNKELTKFISDNSTSIIKMINKQARRSDDKNNFYYLGRKYDIVYTNGQEVILGNGRVFLPRGIDIDAWYKKQASKLFLERLNYNYQIYTRKIPYPSLTIRKMTSRWGVCNTKLKRVTLNLELIKKDPIFLDYVIMHELTHFIHPNHSRDFWNLVEENCKDCKKIARG